MATAPPSPLPAPRPLGRAVAFAAVAVPVGLTGHLAARGQAPDEASVLLAFAAVVLGHRVLVAGRERSWPVLTAWLAAAQLLLHVVLPAAQASGHVHGPAGGAAPSAPLMVAAHAVAAAVLGWFLRQGERALWSAARRAGVRLAAAGRSWRRAHREVRAALAVALRRLLPRDVRRAATASGAGAGATAWSPSAVRSRLVTAGRPRRGPPRAVRV